MNIVNLELSSSHGLSAQLDYSLQEAAFTLLGQYISRWQTASRHPGMINILMVVRLGR